MNEDELLENFFTEILSIEDQKQIHVLLQSDSKCTLEFVFQKHLKKAILLNEREALKKELQYFEATLLKAKSSIIVS
jgi:hypothetical protein